MNLKVIICCFTNKKSPSSADLMFGDTLFMKQLSSLKKGRLSDCQVILCLATRMCAVLFGNKHACQMEYFEQEENKFPALCTLVVSGFILIHFSAASGAVIDSKGKDCSYTNHFSSGKNWFNDNIQWPQSMGQRERYIMKKGRLIMEDHKAISISLTSILEHSSFFF